MAEKEIAIYVPRTIEAAFDTAAKRGFSHAGEKVLFFVSDDRLLVMRPHANDFDGTRIINDLIHQTMLDIDAPGRHIYHPGSSLQSSTGVARPFSVRFVEVNAF